MAHGVSQVLVEAGSGGKMTTTTTTTTTSKQMQQQPSLRKSVGVMGSRRIFAPAFKLKVLDSYRNDIDCRGNQRATARKYGIHRRQIQKWLQCEDNLRSCCAENSSSSNSQQQKELLQQTDVQQQQQHPSSSSNNGAPAAAASPALNLSLARLHGDEQQQHPPPPPPPPPPPSAQTLAAQQQQHATDTTTTTAINTNTAATYRFHGAPSNNNNTNASSPSSLSPTSTSSSIPGYPDLMDKIPIHQPYHSTPATDAYSMLNLYQQQQQQPHPTASGYQHQHQHHHHNHHRHHRHHDHDQRHLVASSTTTAADLPKSTVFGVKLESPSSSSSCLASPSSSSFSSSSSLHSEDEEQHHNHHHHHHQLGLLNRRSSLGSSNDIVKTERASPDSLGTPLDSVASTPTTTTTTTTTSIGGTLTAFVPYSRDHRMIILEDDDYPSLRIPSNGSSSSSSISGSSSSIGSPLPSSISQQDQLECLPPSPRDSERSSCASSDSEMDQQTGTNVSADLARRRSFSLRFKLDVLDAFHRDAKVAGNQRATARKFGINRRQVQKWLGQESELRGVIELCASRQRLVGTGPTGQDVTTSLLITVDEVTPVDLTTISTPYIDSSSSLTPPYSAPGCSLSCCQEPPAPRTYYCYSPGEAVDSSSNNNTITTGIKRTLCTQSCCYPCGSVQPPAAKKPCLEEDKKEEDEAAAPIQEMPLCLVKPKSDDPTLLVLPPQRNQVEPVSSTVPSPPAATPSAKKDAILFKPYLDNPVVGKPSFGVGGGEDPANCCPTGQLNNNCQETCNLNERANNKNKQQSFPDLAVELSFELPPPPHHRASWGNHHHNNQPQPSIQGSHYLDFHQARSAFVRYPATVHYSS